MSDYDNSSLDDVLNGIVDNNQDVKDAIDSLRTHALLGIPQVYDAPSIKNGQDRLGALAYNREDYTDAQASGVRNSLGLNHFSSLSFVRGTKTILNPVGDSYSISLEGISPVLVLLSKVPYMSGSSYYGGLENIIGPSYNSGALSNDNGYILLPPFLSSKSQKPQFITKNNSYYYWVNSGYLNVEELGVDAGKLNLSGTSIEYLILGVKSYQ